MSYSPDMRTEAFELFLGGNSPAAIAKELKRRHKDDSQQTPSAKTLEKWAYTPDAEGLTWSEKRYKAEAAAQAAVTNDYVSAKGNILAGLMKLQAKLQERALEAATDGEVGNATQEAYALLNTSKSVVGMLNSQLAEDARQKDAIDCLVEACRRIVPNWATLEIKIRAEFDKLLAAKGGGGQ